MSGQLVYRGTGGELLEHDDFVLAELEVWTDVIEPVGESLGHLAGEEGVSEVGGVEGEMHLVGAHG
ncbi:MAG: hypothetical protein ACRDVM_05355 [Acidimicrobiia bacterium]